MFIPLLSYNAKDKKNILAIQNKSVEFLGIPLNFLDFDDKNNGLIQYLFRLLHFRTLL